jgi:Family of unknown function (DUF5681)
MAEHTPLPETPNSTQPSDATPDYAVGYGRPPIHTKFKPGHTKRGGRTKRQRNARTVLKETLDEKITIREGKKTRSVTKFHAMILRMMNDAVSGNAKAQSNVIALARSLGLIGDPQEVTNTEPITTDDLAMMVDFLRRHGNEAEPVQPSNSTDKPEKAEAEPASKETKEKTA